MPAQDESTARRQIAEVAREIYGRKLSGASDGNLSVRLTDGHFATTPTGVHKGRMRPEDVVIVDAAGRTLGPGKPSSELALHLAAYQARPDVHAVIHGHPPMAIAYQLAGGHLSEVLVSEVVFACGIIATAPYSRPTTQQVPDVLAPFLRCYDVILMERHGSVTLGPDLDTALVRLDALEHTALIYCTVKMMGGAQPIAPHEVDQLFAIAKPQPPPYRQPGAPCPSPEPQPPVDERLIQAVLAALGNR